MIKRLFIILGLVCAGLAAWPAWADGTPVQRLGSGAPTAMAAAPDGATLAVGTSAGVWFFAADTLTPLSRWDTGQWVQALAYSRDGRYLRAGDRFYDTTTGTAALLVPADLAWQAKTPAPEHDCSADGQRCLVYNLDNLIVRDQDTRIDTALLRTGLLFGAAWSPDSRTIYTAVYSGVQAWDAASGQLKHSQTDFFNSALYGVHWSADGTRVGSGTLAWEVTTGQPAAPLICGTPTAPADCGVPSYDLWEDVYLQVYDQHCYCRWRAINPHDLWVSALGFSLDGAELVTSGYDHYAYACPAGAPQSIGDGQCWAKFASTRIWDAKTFKLLGQLPVAFDDLAVSADGALVVGRTQDTLQAWDWAAGRSLWSVAQVPTTLDDLTIRPTGSLVAGSSTANNHPETAVWRLSTGERVTTLTGHTEPDPWPTGRLGDVYGIPWYQRIHATGLAFSPDGKHLAASSMDGTVVVWGMPE